MRNLTGPADAGPGPAAPPVATTAIGVLAGVVVLLTAGLAYALSVRGVVILWIPSGVVLGILLSQAPRVWPAVLTGAYLGNLAADLGYIGVTPLSFLGPAANVAETVMAALVLRKLIGRTNLLASVRGVAALVLGAAVLANGMTALLGGALMALWYGASYWSAWLNWWVGDGLGMIVVTPAVLGLLEGLKVARKMSSWRPALEGAALVLAVLAVSVWVFDRPANEQRFVASTYLVYPLLIWIAIRLGPGVSAAAVCGLAAVALRYSALDRGPLVDPVGGTLDQAANLYAFLGLASLSVLVPAAAIAEREQAAERVRASEARYRALVETAGDAIVTVGATGRIQFSNPAIEHLVGFPPPILAGKSIMDLIPDHNHEPLEAAFRRLSADQGRVPWRGIELTVRHRDGREIPVEVAVGEWTADGGHFYTGIVRDLSERKRLEDDLRHSRQLDTLGQLTGGVAHEFRNELTIIIMNAELALDGPPSESHDGPLREIRDAANRSSALTKQLLAFARRQSLQPVVLDLDVAVGRSVATVGPLLGKGIAVAAGGCGGTKLVRVDPNAFQQVLLNLMINAKDAMHAGGRLRVQTGIVDLDGVTADRLGLAIEGRYASLEIADEGAGMDAGTLSRVFEPFFTTKANGTGLGLAAVYGIVKQSSGAIRVDSTLGAGTTFRIYLPFAA